MNLCPLGSGAIAGATLALDRNIAARALYFDGPTPNSMDATSDRDFALEFTQALAVFGIHISRFAEELTLYSTAEFGFLDLPEAFSTGSSAMPQKKNPDLTELFRGKSGRLIGAATALTVLIKGLPLAYNKDLQEGQDTRLRRSRNHRSASSSVIPSFTDALKFRFHRMQPAAETGYLNAMAAATYLSNKGVPFRKAHEHIGNAVRLGLETNRELQHLTLDELRTITPEFGEDFFAAITLEATLDCHDVIGGTARARVRTAFRRQNLVSPHNRMPHIAKVSSTRPASRSFIVRVGFGGHSRYARTAYISTFGRIPYCLFSSKSATIKKGARTIAHIAPVDGK